MMTVVQIILAVLGVSCLSLFAYGVLRSLIGLADELLTILFRGR